MKSVKRTEIDSEEIYIVECPYCGDFTRLFNYLENDEWACCESCKEGFEIAEDD